MPALSVCRMCRPVVVLTALALVAWSAPAPAETTFLEDWLAKTLPVAVGRQTLQSKTGSQKLELLWLNEVPDKGVKAYRHKTNGSIILCRGTAEVGDGLMLRQLDGKFVKVNAADYLISETYEGLGLDSKKVYVILDDYRKLEDSTMKDGVVFLPVQGAIEFESFAWKFDQALRRIALHKPACVVVQVDSPGGRN